MNTVETSDATGETRIEGLAAAALLAAGAGAFVLGLLTTLAEASTGTADFLQFNDRVGPLSGKTIIAAIAYFGALCGLCAPPQSSCSSSASWEPSRRSSRHSSRPPTGGLTRPIWGIHWLR